MAISKTAMVRGALWGASMMVTIGCGAAQRPGEPSATAQESIPEAPGGASGAAVGEAPQCVDDKDQPVACLSDSDCCAGFVCGKDPELSQRTSYCIYGG